MTTTLTGVNVSPVNMEDRKVLGIKPGDTVRVHQKIVDEKGKSRIQVFDGLVLARKHGSEPGATFTVRKVIDGVGVEKIFPLYSPAIDKIEIIRRSKVRRAKLYYIREKVMREIKRQMRRMHLTDLATESEAEAAARAEASAAAEAKAENEAKEAEEEAQKAEEPAASEGPEAEADKEVSTQTEETQAAEAGSESETPEETTGESEEPTETSKEEETPEPEAEEPKPEEAEESKAEEEAETDEEKK